MLYQSFVLFLRAVNEGLAVTGITGRFQLGLGLTAEGYVHFLFDGIAMACTPYTVTEAEYFDLEKRWITIAEQELGGNWHYDGESGLSS